MLSLFRIIITAVVIIVVTIIFVIVIFVILNVVVLVYKIHGVFMPVFIALVFKVFKVFILLPRFNTGNYNCTFLLLILL